jgi:prevent-host-death family protein
VEALIVDLAEAEKRAAELLGRAAAGEEVIITAAGAPVARIVPYADDAAS